MEDRRKKLSEPRKKGERRGDMKIIVSATEADIYTWAGFYCAYGCDSCGVCDDGDYRSRCVMLLTGLIQASAVVAFSVLFNIMVRFAALLYDIEAIVFTCVSVIATGMMLSLFAGPGKLVSATLRSPATWAYGISAVGIFLLDVYLARYVSATEVSLFGRMAISSVSAYVMDYF